MTWVQVAEWQWTCDGCGRVVKVVDDDRAPEGWVHTLDGRDLCGRCAA